MADSDTLISGAGDFLNGSGETISLIHAFNWASTSVGPLDRWPVPLKTITAFLVRSPVPIVLLWGQDGVMIYNDAYSGFAGSRHPEMLGKNVRDGWPEVAEFNDHVMKVVLAGGTLAYRDQELTLHRNGKAEAAWMNLDYSPVLDESGRPAGVIAIVVETTNRVLADRGMAARQEQQRRMLQQMPGFVALLTGPDHVYEYVNDAFVKNFGRSDVIGRTVRDVFPELAEQGFHELLDHVWASGQTVVRRGMAMHLQGAEQTHYIDFVYDPIRDDTGAVTGIFVGGYEVTDVLRAAEALRELNADLERQITERTQARGRTWQVTPDLLGALDENGHFRTSNPAWNTVLGWSEDEVARMSIFELLHPDDVERTREGFALTQQGQPAIGFPNRYRCKDGSYRWISWVGVPEDGMVYCSGRDITAEKAAEVELAKAQEALRQAQKMEAIGQLTGGIAHDFNNLLASISGSLELLERRLQQGRFRDVHQYITAAQSSTRRAAALTQRLLAFSRRQTLDPKPTDANQLIAGMKDLLLRSIGPETELNVVQQDELWLTRIDASQLENALLNLCINARDAMPDGGCITIETSNLQLDAATAARREIAAGEYVSVCVTDNGSGMPPEIIAQAFEPFFTTKPLGQGTGLGLSMIQGFVRQSGGQVVMASKPREGTSITLYLPRYDGRLDTAAIQPPSQVAAPAQGGTVLVIDDEPGVRMLIVEVLQDAGYITLEAADGPQGLEILQSDSRIDLLITDVGLPGGMNGRQVADAAQITRPDLKVLFVTGYAENAVIRNGHLAPGMQVITKPFVMTVLEDKVREMIDGHTGRGPSSA